MSGLSLSKVLNSKAGWYRGDFHVHTTFSDGHHSPQELAQMAKAEGLDFIAVTDHNSIAAFSEFGKDLDVLIIPGIEVTLTDGDFNVFGMEGWLDWMAHICAGEMRTSLNGQYRTTTEVMRRTWSQGLLNSINHPLLKPWEWRDGATDLRYVHCLEIWNDPWWPDNVHGNPQAVALWTAWLNAGYRITAIGGSDFHFFPGKVEGYPGERPGVPTTYVYAEELSGAAILASLRQRRAYVSIGPQVTFQAHANGATYDISADLGALSGEIEFTATISGSPDAARAELIKNGSVIAEALVQGGQASLRLCDQVDAAQSAWHHLEVFDQDGQMLALTNPVFVGPRREPELYEFQDFLGGES